MLFRSSDFKTPADLAKSWVNAQKLIGKEKIPLPGEKATKEDWDVVFSRLGRPEKPEGYTLPEIEVPDDFPLPAEEDVKAVNRDEQEHCYYSRIQEKLPLYRHLGLRLRRISPSDEIQKNWYRKYSAM